MFAAVDLDRLDDATLDQLPHGAIAIDRAGRIVHYNEVEARRARLRRWQVIGRDFFRELGWTVGPDAVQRIRAFHAGCAVVPAGFTARVVAHGVEREVAIRLARGA